VDRPLFSYDFTLARSCGNVVGCPRLSPNNGSNRTNDQTKTDHGLRSNRLLGALEPASRERIDPHLEPIEFKLGDMVCVAGGLLKHAKFLIF
jgi:hypothetical protein